MFIGIEINHFCLSRLQYIHHIYSQPVSLLNLMLSISMTYYLAIYLALQQDSHFILAFVCNLSFLSTIERDNANNRENTVPNDIIDPIRWNA